MKSIMPNRDVQGWLIILALTVISLFLQEHLTWMSKYPKNLIVPFADWLNFWMEILIKYLGWFFLSISWLLEWPIKGAQWLLHSLPWVVIVFLISLTAYIASGWRLAFFTLLATFYMVVIGYWEESMNTLALVMISVPLAIIIGFGIGIWGFYSKKAERVIMPTLDIFQTVPTFAYLLPILLLFGFGTVVGLIASILYSFPPMVRNTILGLRRVPDETIESGIMSGATAWQLFWQVRVPSSIRQLLLGVNQSTMASLSMVIIAAIIGGTADIGWEVLYYIRKAEVGQSLVVGIVIALMAIVIDRITSGLALKSDYYSQQRINIWGRYKFVFVAAFGALVFFVLAEFFLILKDWPYNVNTWLAGHLNDLFISFVKNFRSEIKLLKTYALFFVMLPTKIGLHEAISPFTWGFKMTLLHKVLYFGVFLVVAGWLLRDGRKTIAITLLFFMIFLYFGLTHMPWPALILIYSFAAWKIGGKKLALGTIVGLGFIVVVGMWPEAMISVYLCGIAVVFCFVSGTLIGIWAAHNLIVSAIIRPINDTLQTMPLFVILIPFVMLFKIGDFTALLAIIIYAIVPAIRYSEHGIRNLPEHVIEAAQMMGSTKWQLLWQVKIPLALPVIMLGLNQTIMYGIAMLVIAALIGTNGLEQIVFIGLTDGNMGKGFVAGISMAIIAMIVDQMTKAVSEKRSQALGLDIK